jgi:uncharacterized protein (TIGR02145 family)
MKTFFFSCLPFSVLLLCPVVLQAQDAITVGTSTSYSIRSATAATVTGDNIVYKWLENGVELPGAIEATYTNPLGKAIIGEYTYVRLAKSSDCGAWMTSNVLKVIVNNAATASYDTFKDFIPNSDAAAGSTWTLTDTRDNKVYVVKKMADLRTWMVQDLKFGNCVDNSTTTWHEDNSRAATMHAPTVADSYVGHCRSTTYTGVGYLYNWPAALQHTAAYYGSNNPNIGCRGTDSGSLRPNPAYCRGICPVGWHVPTSAEFKNLRDALMGSDIQITVDNFGAKHAAIDIDPLHWHGVLGGYCDSDGSLHGQGNSAHYWISAYNDDNNASNLCFPCGGKVEPDAKSLKNQGLPVRCVKNY